MAQQLGRAIPGAQIECSDILDGTPAWFRWTYPRIYLVLVRYLIGAWAWAYAVLDHPVIYRLLDPWRRGWHRLIADRFIRRLRAQPPALIIATHFFPADVAGLCKQAGWITSRLIVVVTDLHPHRFWLTPHADMFVVATPHGAGVCRRWHHHVPVVVAGIPISPAFSEAGAPGALKQRLGLAETRLTVLVTSGGTTVGAFERVVELLMAMPEQERLQLVVVCGDNPAATERLRQRAAQAAMPVLVFGFIDHMAQVMGAADVVVAKAGGLTVFEALGLGRPLILYHIIPGQEQLNASHVTSHGAGVIAKIPQDVPVEVRRLLEDPGRLQRMQEAARSLGRPDAAARIVEEVVVPMLRRHHV